MKKLLIVVLLASLLGCSGHNYGLTHAVPTSGIVCGVGYAARGMRLPTWAKYASQFVVGAVIVNHFYEREKRARDGLPFDQWDEHYGSSDTQWDVLSPALGVGVGMVLC